MKIIVTATAPEFDAPVDPRFGRGAYFIVVDADTLEWQAYPNPGVDADGGAGTQAAQFVMALNPEVVISGDFGPNAYLALAAAETNMALLGQGRTVREVVADYAAGRLQPVNAPTSGGRHSGR